MTSSLFHSIISILPASSLTLSNCSYPCNKRLPYIDVLGSNASLNINPNNNILPKKYKTKQNYIVLRHEIPCQVEVSFPFFIIRIEYGFERNIRTQKVSIIRKLKNSEIEIQQMSGTIPSIQISWTVKEARIKKQHTDTQVEDEYRLLEEKYERHNNKERIANSQAENFGLTDDYSERSQKLRDSLSDFEKLIPTSNTSHDHFSSVTSPRSDTFGIKSTFVSKSKRLSTSDLKMTKENVKDPYRNTDRASLAYRTENQMKVLISPLSTPVDKYLQPSIQDYYNKKKIIIEYYFDTELGNQNFVDYIFRQLKMTFHRFSLKDVSVVLSNLPIRGKNRSKSSVFQSPKTPSLLSENSEHLPHHGECTNDESSHERHLEFVILVRNKQKFNRRKVESIRLLATFLYEIVLRDMSESSILDAESDDVDIFEEFTSLTGILSKSQPNRMYEIKVFEDSILPSMENRTVFQRIEEQLRYDACVGVE